MQTKQNENVSKLIGTINTVVMHKSPHLDEIVAYYLLMNYAGLKACIRFVETDIIGTEEDHDRNGILPIGCGENCRFNEHRKGVERIKGECATTLVAKFLWSDNVPSEAKRLIAEVLACDTKAGCSPTQLAELVKVANRCIQTNPAGVLTWAITAIKAIVKDEQYHFTAPSCEKSLVAMLKALDAEGKYFSEDKRVREHIFRLAHESVRNSENCVTELASIIKAMYRLPYAENDITNWVETPLLQICVDQLEFQKLVDEFRKQKMIEVTVLGNRGDGIIDCLVVKSDSLQAPRAARYAGAKVVLVRNSKGNIMVCVDTRLQWLNLTNLTRMIRWLELPVDGKNVDWKSLGIPGSHDSVPHWYYFKKGEQLFNGSQTNSAPASKVGTQALVEALEHAFHPRLVAQWCKVRHIERYPESDGVKSLETALSA